MMPEPRRFRLGAPVVPGVRRLRNGWRRLRPYPRPQYLKDTPTTGGDEPLDIFCPPTALTLAEAAMSDEAVSRVIEVLGRLAPSKDHDSGQAYYAYSRNKYGKYWKHADLPRMLWAAATLLKPKTYLEIGVWRGRSAAIVGSIAPGCAIYGFDMWISEYHGSPTSDPDFVRQELTRIGHQGPVALITGDSKKTVPEFLSEHPELFFDIITIDGDKSIVGCGTDFANTLPRLKVGGVVIFDDIPTVPSLDRLWDDLIRRDHRFVSWDFNDAGFGVAVGLRAFA